MAVYSSKVFSIIVLNYNGKKLLETFFPSIVQSKHSSFEIILVDNHSSDNSIQWMQEHYPNVHIVVLDKNYGYCKGNNKGCLSAKGRYLIFLNNDVAVQPNWLLELQKAFSKYPKIGALQPKILNYYNPSHFEYAGGAGGFLDRWGYPFCRGRIFDHCEKDTGQYDVHSNIIFWGSGCCFLVKRDLFHRLGGFDSLFQFHMEEIDLCWRIWRAGYEVRYIPRSIVYHAGMQSLSYSSHKIYLNFRNNILMLYKNLTLLECLKKIPIRLFMDYLGLLHFLSKKQWSFAWAIIKAHLHVCWLLPYIIKRKQPKKKLKYQTQIAPFLPKSIAWQYHFRNRKTFHQIFLSSQN